eukprot:9498851-Pyramimonas_sp.AAC.1
MTRQRVAHRGQATASAPGALRSAHRGIPRITDYISPGLTLREGRRGTSGNNQGHEESSWDT